MRYIFILLLFLTNLSNAQEVQRDTSYTFYSAYKKISKNYPFIQIVENEAEEDIKAREDVVYRSIGQRNLLMNIYYPASAVKEENYPGILLIHGGGWRTGDKYLMIPMAQQLASLGYVAAVVEYRLSLEATYPAAVHDLKAAVRWLRANSAEFSLDTTKIAAYGTSAGGQLAALLGTTNDNEKLEGVGDFMDHSSDVQAIINVDGVLAFKHPESSEGTMAAQWLGGTYDEVSSNWIEASALTHVGKDTPPVLFISSSFPRFHAGKKDVIEVLDEHGIYYESYSIPESPHSFWLFHPWFTPTLEYTAEFLEKVFNESSNR